MQTATIDAAEVDNTPESVYAENKTAQYLECREDETGQPMWFYRIQVVGLRPRLIGPFTEPAEAVAAYDHFLKMVLDGIEDCLNELSQKREFIELPIRNAGLHPKQQNQSTI